MPDWWCMSSASRALQQTSGDRGANVFPRVAGARVTPGDLGVMDALSDCGPAEVEDRVLRPYRCFIHRVTAPSGSDRTSSTCGYPATRRCTMGWWLVQLKRHGRLKRRPCGRGCERAVEASMKYRVLVEQDEDGMFVAEVPSLPGCISQGKTRSEAVRNIQEAMQAYLESLKAHDEPIPPSINEEVVEVAV